MNVVAIFDNLGPYHIARMEAAAARVNVHVVEEWGLSAAHAWKTSGAEQTFSRTTLFPDSHTRTTARVELRRAVVRSLDQLKPDVVAIPGWSDAGAIAALRWCCQNRVPSVLMCTSSRLQDRSSWLKETIKKRIVPLYSAGFGGGVPHRDYMVSLGMNPDHVFLGYNAVDNDHFQRGADVARADETAVRATYGLPRDYFLGSWRFIPEKNIPSLLRAYAYYVSTAGKSAWKFVMLGDGPLHAEVVRLQAELGLKNHLILPGFVQHKDLPVYYGLARAFVLASVYETWGLVINEAMAAGLPVAVSTACGCHLDLVQSGMNGWTFDPQDETAITRTLWSLAESESRLASMGEASRGIIGDWSLGRFADGFQRASETAAQVGAKRSGLAAKAIFALV